MDPVRLRRRLVMNGCIDVPIAADHALALEELPPLHRDPFDRILIAQAPARGMKLVTVDARVAECGEGVLPV